MTHSRFEEWIFSDDPKSVEESMQLDAHLKECPACAQLRQKRTQVEFLFTVDPQVRPRQGFDIRFEERLAADTRTRKTRWTLFWVALTMVGTGFAFLFNLGQVYFAVASIPESLLYWYREAIHLIAFKDILQPIFVGLINIFPVATIFPIIFSIAAIGFLFTLLSGLSVRKFVSPGSLY